MNKDNIDLANEKLICNELKLISNLELSIDDLFKAGYSKKMVMENIKEILKRFNY